MIPLIKVGMPPKEVLLPALEETLYSGMVAEGSAVYQFESEFSAHYALKNCLAMSSGTAALHAALHLAGVGPGDEVISTPMTAEPTNMAILYCGAKVVWADVNPETGNICPESVRQRLTHRTKAIICVHYAGYPVDLTELSALAMQKQVALIEDCAHAQGAKYDGMGVGSFGDYGIFSFQAIKHMTTVDGGMLIISDASKMESAKKFRWFGMLKGVDRKSVDIDGVGYKYNMHNVAATIGLAQLKGIDQRIGRHISNGRYYDGALCNIFGVKPATVSSLSSPSYWLYTLLCEDSEDLEVKLNEFGIAASKLHRPNNLHSIFKASDCELPGLRSFYKRLLHIPCGWWLQESDRQNIVEIIKKG